MRFGMAGRMGQGMRQIVRFVDRYTGVGNFGGNVGHCTVTNGIFAALRPLPTSLCDFLLLLSINNAALLTAGVKSKLTHVIQGGKAVNAVTSLGDDVFVMRFDSRQVEVYDARTFTLQRQLTVHRFYSLTGLAACAHHQCLYVSDYNQDIVQRAELSGSQAVKQWSVASGPRGLSVNKAHNVVMACYGADKIQEYTTHGALVREISLEQAGVTNPWHAVQLSTGDYVVSEHTSPRAVSVVGVDGQLVCRYLTSETSNVGQMSSPTSLAVTENDDILVADTDNKRILLINRSLSSARELALPVDGGIQWPWGLCLDESRGRLYVGEDGGSCQVLVFDGVRL